MLISPEERRALGPRATLIAAVAAALLLLFCVLLPAVSNARAYGAAKTLRDVGQYEDAVAAFEAMGDYKDAPEQLAATYYAWGESLLLSRDYASAAAAFDRAGPYRDAPARAEACRARIGG